MSARKLRTIRTLTLYGSFFIVEESVAVKGKVGILI